MLRFGLLFAPILLEAYAQLQLDIAPFARFCCVADKPSSQTLFDYGAAPGRNTQGQFVYGLQWAEARDVEEIQVTFRTATVRASLEYWNQTWPQARPEMPVIGDPIDDPWQGKWIRPALAQRCEGRTCKFTFPALDSTELNRARFLPGVRYRNTLKVRLLFDQPPVIESIHVYTGTRLKPMRVRVDSPGALQVSVYSGVLRAQRDRELLVDVATPSLPGSEDITVVQVRNGSDSFAFAPIDLERGPIWIPDRKACITAPGQSCAKVPDGQTIRERLASEPEQTYTRASREIPALDPMKRAGDPLYLPLAADSSWQKFAVSWGGHIYISKRGTKALGRDLARLTWTGDRIDWRIGTGEKPDFRDKTADSELRVLEDILPVAQATWRDCHEEAFATLLSGPLAPDGRDESVPAVLLVRLRGSGPFWLKLGDAQLALRDGLLLAGDNVRAHVRGRAELRNGMLRIDGPGADLAIPFIPGLTAAQRSQLASLDYDQQRDRIVAYWRNIVTHSAPFEIPEQRFHTFLRAVLAHIRISATRDSESGLYMLPAASYRYNVYENEACFQTQLLDALGDHEAASQYLEPFVKLQGSKAMPGAFTDQSGVYHGVRISADRDYTAHDYNLDHGTVLWTLLQHYRYTGDRDWLIARLGSLRRAADWITSQRQLTKQTVDGEPCPEFGLLPAGNLEDARDWKHWFSVNAYASAGLTAFAAVLQEIGDSRTHQYQTEAAAYRGDLRRAVLGAVSRAPVTRLRNGTYVPWVPPHPHQRIRQFGPVRVDYYRRYGDVPLPTYKLTAVREVLYGPLILLDTGVFGTSELLAQWVLDDWEDNTTMSTTLGINPHGWVSDEYWFSRGGMVFQPNLQNPIHAYLERGEGRAAIRSLYNNFVASWYPAVNVFNEEFYEWSMPGGPFYKVADEARFLNRLRDCLVTESGEELVLAAGVPTAWLKDGIRVNQAPTRLGPVTYSLQSTGNGFHATISSCDAPARLHLRREVHQVKVNGQSWSDFESATGIVHLPKTHQKLEIEAE